MPRISTCLFASLVSGVSAALILATGSSYTEARFPQGTAHHLRAGRSTCYAGGGEVGCWTTPSQIASLNSADDFCLWAPSQPVPSVSRDPEHTMVAWCLKGAHSTHLIPDAAILGARLLITPEYVQITGVGNLSHINVPSEGVASASGDRFHSLVFTSAYGQLEQIYDWTSFVSQDRFCFRACRSSAVASTICPPVRDVFGCADDAPGSYDVGTFEDCIGDTMNVPSALFQGVLAASSHENVHPFSSCMPRRVVSDARVTHPRRTLACAPNCTATSSTSFSVPTTSDNATSPLLPTSTSSGTYTNSSMPSSIPMSTVNDTCTLYSYPHWHPHYRFSVSFASPSPSSSLNVSFSSSGCWGAASCSPPSTSSASSPACSMPSFTPTISAYSSSDTISFGMSPSITGISTPTTSTSTSMYDSSDPLPVITSPSGANTSSPTLASTASSSPEFSPSSFSSSSSLASPPLTLSSATSTTLFPTSSPSSFPSSSASSFVSSQNSSVPVFTSPSSFPSNPTTSSESSQSPTISIPSSSASSVPLSVSTFSTSPSPSFANSQTQIGSQCPPRSLAALNGASRLVGYQALFLLSLILTIVSLPLLVL